MKNKLKIAAIVVAASAIIIPVLVKVNQNSLPYPTKFNGKTIDYNMQLIGNVPISQQFNLTFPKVISNKQASLVEVVDENNKEVPVKVKINSNTLTVIPADTGYDYGKEYIIKIPKIKSHWYSIVRSKNIAQFSINELGDIVRPVDGKINKSGNSYTVTCDNGTSVFSDLPGNVESINKSLGTIIINHNNGLKSKYTGVKSFENINKGQALKKGDLIGKAKTNFKINFIKNSIEIGMNKYLKYEAKEKYILTNADMTLEDRMVSAERTYKVDKENSSKYFIEIGNSRKWIFKNNGAVFDEKPREKNTLGWCYVSNEKSNKLLLADKDYYCNSKSSVTGIGIISPTWFSVSGNVNKPSSITLNSIANLSFTKNAHSNGYLVWGLVSNASDKNGEDSKAAIPRTKYILSSSELRNKIEDELVSYATKNDLDGINVDFEGFGDEDVNTSKNNFSTFIKELHEKLKKENIKLSVDVTVSDGSLEFSKCYDREGISANSDYVIVMLYDEHWHGSKAGSVSSYTWSKNNIINTLKEIEKDKFIMGVPLYGREYILDKSGNSIKDRVLTISDMAELSNAKASTKEYDSYSKQNVIKYTGTDGYTHVFWQEDLNTLAWRAQLSKQYNTVGIAGWQLSSAEDNKTEKLIEEAFKNYYK